MANSVNYTFSAKDTKRPNLTVSAKPSKMESNITIVTIGGIEKNDIEKVVNNLKKPDGNPKDSLTRVEAKGSILIMKVKNDMMEVFLKNRLKNIMGELERNNYAADCIDTLLDKTDFALNKPDDEAINKLRAEGEDAVADLWTDYLNKINDPIEMKVLNLYSQIYGDSKYGHLLSLRNVLMIRAMAKKYGTNPTFVLGSSVWNKFGRGIKRDAKMYPLFRLRTNKGDATKEDKREAMDKCGFPAMSYEELGATIQHMVDIDAENAAYVRTHNENLYNWYVGYDISDTYLFDPKVPDPLYSKPGITSNIEYKLNQLASEIELGKNDVENELGSGFKDTMEKNTKIAADFISQVCAKKKIQMANGETPTATLINGLKAYYRTIIPVKANIIKQENIDGYANDATHLTLIMLNVGLGALNSFSHGLTYTKKEAAALGPIIMSTIMSIGRQIQPNANVEDNAEENAETLNEMEGNDAVSMFIQGIEKIGGKVVDDEEGAQMNLSEAVVNFLKSYNDTLYKINGGYIDGE